MPVIHLKSVGSDVLPTEFLFLFLSVRSFDLAFVFDDEEGIGERERDFLILAKEVISLKIDREMLGFVFYLEGLVVVAFLSLEDIVLDSGEFQKEEMTVEAFTVLAFVLIIVMIVFFVVSDDIEMKNILFQGEADDLTVHQSGKIQKIICGHVFLL